MPTDEPIARAKAWRLRETALVEEEAALILEEPLEIHVDGELYATVMRTPGDDIALAAGFCLAEGLIGGAAEIGAIAACEVELRNLVSVTRAGEAAARVSDMRRRRTIVSTACGLCGAEMVEEAAVRLPRPLPSCQVTMEAVLGMTRKMQDHQRHFQLTGGTHAAAIFDAAGELLSFGEDIGRHNAFDKAVGGLLLDGRLEQARVAALSGRCSFEMVQKAARAGIPVVASVSAPTHLAVELGRRIGLAVVGFVRERSLTVYHHAGRIAGIAGPDQLTSPAR